jgi:ATP-binding cassette subfamily B protein
MTKTILNKAKSTFVQQHDSSDCGIACLLSVIKYYNGECTFERLRELSGTTQAGTTLLGLYQSASRTGFNAEGCEADSKALTEHGQPLILHISLKDNEHFVVCYGFNGKEFIIGDPAKGIEFWTIETLEKVWNSKACLILYPNEKFEYSAKIKKTKKSWTYTLIKEDFSVLIPSGVMGVIIAALGMAMAVFSQKLIDDILPDKNSAKLWTGIGLLTFLLCARMGIYTLRKYFLLRQEKSFNNRIVSLFYDSLLFLPKSFFDNRKTGDLIARLNDTRRIQNVICQLFSNTVIDALIIIISLLFLFVYSWKIALIATISVPPLFFIIYKRNPEIIKHQQDVMRGYALSESNFINTIQGITIIKSFNKQNLFSGLNKDVYSLYMDKIFNLGLINTKLGWISGLCSIFVLMAILAYSAMLVLDEDLKLGELMAILTICNSIIPSIASLALIIIPINEAKVAFERMFEFINIKPEDKEINDRRCSVDIKSLNVENVSFRFPGRPLLLREISFVIHKGEITSIIGECGCGKSTVSYLLSRLYEFESGDIILDGGISIKDINVNDWRELVGIAPQEIHMFNGNILSNICFDNSNIQDIIDFFNKYGFNKYFDRLPQGVYTIVGEEGIKLSGGQKQLVALARALFKNPKLLILDEITSAMDRNTEQFVLKLLLKLKTDMAILFISHKLHILRDISDTICIMDSGKIQVVRNHSELMQDGI